MFHLEKQLIIYGCVFLLLLIIGIIVFLNRPKRKPINTFVGVGEGSNKKNIKIISNNFKDGFFSNFLRYIAWTLCNVNDKIIFHFVDTSENKENIWNVMFEQPKYKLSDLSPDNFGSHFPTKGYPSPLDKINNGYIYRDANIYRNEHFQQIRHIYNAETKKLILTPYIKEYINTHSKGLVYPEETIAVFIRYPGHYSDNNDNIYNMISEVEELLNKHKLKYIYLVTMVEEYVKLFVNKFKDKVILFGNKRFTSINMDWLDEMKDYKEESIDCFCEVYVASKCKFVVGASSNMLLGCLFLNPTMSFKIFDTHANSNGL
jgi:hypothetical protein